MTPRYDACVRFVALAMTTAVVRHDAVAGAHQRVDNAWLHPADFKVQRETVDQEHGVAGSAVDVANADAVRIEEAAVLDLTGGAHGRASECHQAEGCRSQ